MLPELSLVVPTFNRRETLAVVLPSLLEQKTRRPYEILLCDSGSTDGTADLVASFHDPRLRHLVGENRGRSGARNLGIREARAPLVLFTDADIIADPHLVEEHFRIHEGQAAPCAVVGREVQVDTLQEYERVRGDLGQGRTLHPDARKTLSWLYFLTGNASVPRAALEAVGRFDENFTGYGHEDLELGYRLRRHGLQIRYNPRAVNYHWHPVGFEEKCQKMRLAGISTVRFYNKHRDVRIKLLLGMNPLSLTAHWILSRTRWFLPFLEARQGSRFWSEILLQYHYLCGVQEGRRSLPSGPPAGVPVATR